VAIRAGVVVFPGTNCDQDTVFALRNRGGWDVVTIWHRVDRLPHLDLVLLPGGFSYGDYLRAGAMAAHSPVIEWVQAFAERGGVVIGICNGFQILCEMGLLPGALIRNRSLKFICKVQSLRLERIDTKFTMRSELGTILRMPIAHGEGAYIADPALLARLEKNRQIIFRYCDDMGRLTDEANPNGSIANIAGVINQRGNVLGLMPHPERACESLLGGEDGKLIFDSVNGYLQGECRVKGC